MTAIHLLWIIPAVLVFGAVAGYNIWDLGSGSYTLPELELKAGENAVSVTGTGTITFTYQEAGL